jgi:hypothetical protein
MAHSATSRNMPNKFRDALHLFDYCNMQNSVLPGGSSSVFMAWCFLAARDAVMSVWHFRNEMMAANNFAKLSTYVEPQIDWTAIHEAHSKFDLYFPDFAAVRHAVAHAGELAKNKTSFEQNAFSGDYEGAGIQIKNAKRMVIEDGLQNRTYTCTHGGRIVHCEISGTSLVRLHEIMGHLYRGFTSGPSATSPPKSAD